MKNQIGYRIFYRYLDYIWNEEHYDTLAVLLGGMSWLADGSTADPAYESDWDEAIAKSADPNDSYQVDIQFLKDWLTIGYDEEIDNVCLTMESNKRLDLWMKAGHDIQMNLDNPYLRFISK